MGIVSSGILPKSNIIESMIIVFLCLMVGGAVQQCIYNAFARRSPPEGFRLLCDEANIKNLLLHNDNRKSIGSQ